MPGQHHRGHGDRRPRQIGERAETADERQADVIVVGAGPAGSTAATYLARAGLDVLLLEKARFPRAKVCGDGFTPRGMKQIIDLGIDCSEEAGWRWLRGSGEGVATSEGVRIIGFNVDITELRRAEEARQLLVQELDHRLKNLFTVAAGMITGPADAAAGRR